MSPPPAVAVLLLCVHSACVCLTGTRCLCDVRQCGEDALQAVEYGLDGIICSNHGGRQMDFARSGIEVLEEVMATLQENNLVGKIEVLCDGGIRRGSDILKAIALGATGVGIGRPALYGMARSVYFVLPLATMTPLEVEHKKNPPKKNSRPLPQPHERIVYLGALF